MATTAVQTGIDPDNYRKRLAAMLAEGALSTAPVQHPLQGADRMAKALLAGMQYQQADEQAGEVSAWRTKMLAGALPNPDGAGVTVPPVTGAATNAPMGEQAGAAASLSSDRSLPRGIRNNNPLNIEAGDFTASMPGFSGSDGRFARFESPEQGVAAADRLLQTYANKHGLNTVGGIVGRWAPASDGNNVNSYAANVAKQLGVDPGAPLDMADSNIRQRLVAAMGQHENGRPIQMASLSPAGLPSAAPQSAPAQQATVQVAQAPSMRAAPSADPLSGAPPNIRNAIIEGVRSKNRQVQAEAYALAQQYMKPVQPTDDIKEYERSQREPGFKEYMIEMKRASKPETNVNVSTEKKGQELMVSKAVEGFEKSQTAAADANKRIATYGQLAQAVQGFTPGATAEMQLNGARILKDLGIIKGDKVAPAEAFKAVQRRLELASTPRGQGQITENERALIRDTVPSITNAPESIPVIVGALERLDRYDIAVADVYRQNARKNGGVPNYLEISQAVAELGPPMTQDEVIALTDLKAAQGAQAPAAANAGSATSQPVRVTTPEDARKLPSGTPIILPDGSLGRVP